ncbi:putative matrix metalloproteinase-19-like [Apostichopus japonicus]|uniref:Putative matrix metalloproteinase-19-like n=1 Tax=Stichopus japonicus TaxID=307972 RepID=A0A2G8KA16_STIJA|nr:putative matrix metalloproteinase-19-like [Apostichopus japonicus]
MGTCETNLLKYGSVDPPSSNGSVFEQSASPEEVAESIMIIENLTEGEEIDEELMDSINFPKCGVDQLSERDVIDFTTIGRKWSQRHLTYFVTRYSEKLTQEEVDQIIKDAFQVWADVSSLTFSEANQESAANVQIHFQGGSHGDPFPFDGSGGILAHAYPPTVGKCHIDDDENWTTPDKTTGYSILQTMIHELGHVLGLGHSPEPGAVMGRFYRYGAEYRSPSLSEDDITGIQHLYEPPMVETVKPPPPPGACIGTIDAVFYDVHSEQTILFRGSYVWSLEASVSDVTEITSTYDFLSTGVDASFYNPNNQKTFIFKNCYVYRYDDRSFQKRSTTSQTFSSLPCQVDAAVYSESDQLTFVFKNRWVYAYSGKIFFGRIRISSLPWTNIPEDLYSGIDAVADVIKENSVYFFKGDHYY